MRSSVAASRVTSAEVEGNPVEQPLMFGDVRLEQQFGKTLCLAAAICF